MAIATTSGSGFVERMLRAAKLEVPLYEEVEADVTATNQALLVVVLGAVASGIGAAIGAGMATGPAAGNPGGSLIGGVISALIGWAVWSYVLFFVGTRFMGGTASYGELLRTLGFSESPLLLLILSFIPVLGGLLSLVVGIWVLVSGFIATRQALDLDNGKTLITIVLGVVALLVVLIVLGAIFGAIFGLGMVVGRASL
jgi:hypothetical protein